jgi:hypothetical protein
MNRSDLRPGDCRRHPRQYRGVDAARSPLHSISGHCARDRHHRHLPRPLLARAFRRARPSLPSLPAADGTVALGDLERVGVVLRRDIQDERDRLSVRAPLWRHVAIVVSGDCGEQRPSYRFPFRLELSRRSEAAPGGLLAPLPAARLLLHVPALQRRAARPHLRPRPGASFTLASIILPALVLGLAWEFLTLLRVRLGGKLLSMVALAIGGTGLSPLLHVIKSAPSADFLSDGVLHHARGAYRPLDPPVAAALRRRR